MDQSERVPPPGDLTHLLVRWSEGDPGALEQLMPVIYGELRRLAGSFLNRERREHTLETSALIHEAYLRLVDQRAVRWRSRSQFFCLAARMMRRVLVDHARRQLYAKRGAGLRPLPLEEAGLVVHRAPELLALDEALSELSEQAPQQAQVVELRFFGGFSRREVAELLEVSEATVARRWRVARAWLFGQLGASE